MAEKVYDVWLCEKLRSLQLDEDVFLDYLKGVLEEESSLEEKVETIENILQGATVLAYCVTLHPPSPSAELLPGYILRKC